MGTDYNWNDNCCGVVYPDRISFSYDRTWTLNSYGYGHPLSLTCWRNSYGYDDPFPCCRKPYSYSDRYGDSLSCSGNSYDYRHSDPFPCSGNSYNYDYRDPFPRPGNSYNYRHSDTFPFTCSTDPHYDYYTFTHCDCDPNGRCIIVGNTYGYLDLYPDSFSYGSGVSHSLSNSSGVSDSFSNRSDNNNSFVHCSGDSDSDTDGVQYSWPPSFSNGNSVGDQHSFQQSPTCLCQRCERRQYCFQ